MGDSTYYAVQVQEVLCRTLAVKASNLEEAIEKVEKAYRACDIVLDAEDMVGKGEIGISPYFSNGIIPQEDVDCYTKVE